MSTETTPGTPQASDSATLQLLVKLLLAEREDALRERQDKAQALAAREKQRRINAEYNQAEKEQSQSMCTHKKGGRGIKGPKVDYAVGFHTFPDQSSYIRCLICGMKWKSTDTDEFLFRRGQKIPNHTGIGWRRAHQMLGESSNTATSSEVMLKVTTGSVQQEDFVKNPRAVEI